MIRRAILKAVAIPGYQVPFGRREMPMPYGWGTGGIQVTASVHRPGRRAEGDRPGRRRHHQRRLIRRFFARTAGVATTDRHRERHDHPDAPPHPRDAAGRRPDPGLPGADPGAAALARAARDRDPQDACAGGIWPDACQALRGHRALRPHRHDLRLSGAWSTDRYVMDPSPIPKFDNPKLRPMPGAAAVRRRPREADLCHAALYARRQPRLRGPPFRGPELGRRLRPLRGARQLPRRDHHGRRAAGACSSAPTPTIAASGAPPAMSAAGRASRRSDSSRGEHARRSAPVGSRGPRASFMASASAAAMSASRSGRARCWRWSASRARASRRCYCLSVQLRRRRRGRVHYRDCATGAMVALDALSEAERRLLMRTDWGFVHQNPREGCGWASRPAANIGERLMAVGERHYGRIRGGGARLAGTGRDRRPTASTTRRSTFSGGMQQRLQIARNLVTAPAPRLHGRADRRPRRLGAGAAARPDARPGRRCSASRRSSSPTTSRWRGCCRTG